MKRGLYPIHEKSQKFRYGGDRNSESIYLDSEECKNHLQMLNFLFEKGFGETLKDLITQTAGNRDFGFLRIIPETIKEKINNYPSEVLNDGLAISILN